MKSLEQIEGRNPVTEALRSGRGAKRLLVARGIRRGLRPILDLAADSGVPVQEVDRAELDRRALSRGHQGVMLLVEPRRYLDIAEMLELARPGGEDPFLLVAAGIEDPHNLGSLIRSAEGAGVHGVIIPSRRAAGITAAVVKASAGATEYVPVARVVNLVQALEELKKAGLWVYGADAAAPATCYETDLTGPVALVVGGEGRGIRRLVGEHCDSLVSIPIQGRVGSLNAAVAGALVMFEIRRQRLVRRKEWP